MSRLFHNKYCNVAAMGAAAAFVPTDISGLKVWLDARTGMYTTSAGSTLASADGDPVGRWEDQSGQANHFTNATSTKRGTLKTGVTTSSRDAVLFDGVDDYLSCDALASTFSGSDVACSVFVVFKGAATTANPALFAFGSDVADNPRFHFDMLESGTTYRLLRRDDAGTLKSGTGGTRDTNWHRFCYCFDGTTGQLYDNGSAAGSSFDVDVTACTFGMATVGNLRYYLNSDGAAAPFSGHIAAILVYQAALTGGNISSLDSWASGIWG